MPGIVLGLIPATYGILIDDIYVFIFGCFFTLAAGGDILMVFLLRDQSKNTYVQDHPSEVGCYIYKNTTDGTE